MDYCHINYPLIIFDHNNGFMSNSAKQLIAWAKGKNNFNLNIANLGLEELPRELSDLKNLVGLSIQNNSISNCSALGSLSNLETLNLRNNNVSNLSFLEGLTNLKKLVLNKNKITDISALKFLSNLKELSLKDNEIVNITSIRHLKSLEKLELSNNKIDDLKDLQFLTKLKWLSLRNNQVSDLSPILDLIKRGVQVSIIENEYKTSIINIYNNPLQTPPIEVINMGNDAILNYFDELKGGDEIVYEAKLLIIGEAGVGKTTLARKLRNSNAPMPLVDKDTTQGIKVDLLTFEEDDMPDFTMHIWDFGGQEIYHSTHQFFLSKRSLYVLVLDGRIEEDPHYWMQVQDLLGEDSPLLLLLNKKGNIRTQLGFQELLNLYPNLRTPLNEFSLKTDKNNVEQFSQIVAKEIRNLPHFQRGEKVPRKWAKIRRRLERLAQKEKKNYISLKEFRKICEEEGIDEIKRQNFLSDFLHSLGVILHFNNEPLLNGTLILNPTWATDAVYKVLDHTRDHSDTPGRFNKDDLNDIWTDLTYQDMFDHLLALMQKFELCYILPRKNHQYIVPALLSPDRPNYLWDSQEQLQIRYNYTFMPKGIVTRLIVRLNNLIDDQSKVWKRGAIFNYEDSEAEVAELYRDRCIHIKAKGLNRKKIISIIAHEIDEINKTFDFDERLKVAQLVPCNCNECNDSTIPYFFPKIVLDNAKRKAVPNAQCQKSFKMVKVIDLLEDIFTRKTIDTTEFEEVRNYISNGKTKQALSIFDTLLKFEVAKEKTLELKKIRNRLTQLSSQFSDLDEEYHDGKISRDEYQTSKNKIESSFLNLIDEVENLLLNFE